MTPTDEEISTLRSDLKLAREGLEFYASWKNYSIDYDTSQMGVSRRVSLYSDQEALAESDAIFEGRSM